MQIPIFPLNTVLFPDGMLPLKIFEQRYMDMAKTCLRDSTGFGVCLIKEGQEVGARSVPESIGTLANITDWDMPQLGVLQVKVRGGQRFFIHSYQDNGAGLLIAEVTLLDAEPELKLPEEHQPCARALRALMQKAGEEQFYPPHRFDDASWVGHRLAELLPVPLPVKQMMLELSDGKMRLGTMHQFLHRLGLLSTN
ncbi:MAG: LON peptidase substrate-binding domain-containing protein [Burkholderiales bacterium]